MKNENEISAIQDEQQIKSNREIVLEVKKLLLKNRDISYFRAQDILKETINCLGSSPIAKE